MKEFRDELAMSALTALIIRNRDGENLTDSAYEIADQMLESRIKPSKTEWLFRHPNDYLSLPTRLMKAMESQKMDTMAKLLHSKVSYWQTKVPNIGRDSVKTLIKILADHNLELRK
jgi:DNA-directed RNA polymerase alpha subunit